MTAFKYGLVDHVHKMLDCGTRYPMNKWLAITRTAVLDRFDSRWTISCLMYKCLENYQVLVPKIAMSSWWTACKFKPNLTTKCRTIFTLITGTHALGSSRGRFAQNSRICQNCDKYVEESLTHFLLECESLSPQRETLVDKVKNNMPPANGAANPIPSGWTWQHACSWMFTEPSSTCVTASKRLVKPFNLDWHN